jgi:hypothetical protein
MKVFVLVQYWTCDNFNECIIEKVYACPHSANKAKERYQKVWSNDAHFSHHVLTFKVEDLKNCRVTIERKLTRKSKRKV